MQCHKTYRRISTLISHTIGYNGVAKTVLIGQQMHEQVLHKLGISNWSDLAKRFRRADVLLGNGFSRSITPRLRYKSIFREFLDGCQPEQRRIFRGFDTTNFEIILQKLCGARDVNEIFGIETSRIQDSIEDLKEGLIRTIEAIHPRWAETDQTQLERIASHLGNFSDVYTLNYDLYLYRIIQLLRDRRKKDNSVGRYSDYFWEEYDESFLHFDTSKEFTGYRHPYYLHGALFLFKESSYDLKLRKAESDDELLNVIRNMIKDGRMPLFVSEGTPSEKMEAIGRSTYLRFALDRLKKSRTSLVIFGTSLSEPDRHIVDAINHNERDLAVSVHLARKPENEVKSIKYGIKSKFPGHEIEFFDSETFFSF